MTRSVYDNGSWECHMFIKNGDQVALEQLLSRANINTNIRFQNETLLTTAIKSGFPKIVKILLSYGADPNLRSSENGRNEPPLITAIRWKSHEIVTVLVERGADINRTAFYGHDAIFQAVVENTFDILGYLLEKSPDGESSHEARNCPFLTALKYSERFVSKRKCLLILMRHNYLCTCFSREELSNVSQIKINGNSISSKLNGQSILQILNVKTEENVHTIIFVIGDLTLVNLTREALRNQVYMALSFNNTTNYINSIKKLTLPLRLTNFVLYNDIENVTVRRIRDQADDACKIYLLHL